MHPKVVMMIRRGLILRCVFQISRCRTWRPEKVGLIDQLSDESPLIGYFSYAVTFSDFAELVDQAFAVAGLTGYTWGTLLLEGRRP